MVQIDGTIVAPDEPKDWDPKSPRNWIVFSNLKAVFFQGSGTIDGSGSKWWEESCKKNKTNVRFTAIPEIQQRILLISISSCLINFIILCSLAKEHQV